MLANRAVSQAWVAGRNAGGKGPVQLNSQSMIQAVYTDPQVAQVGTLQPGTKRVKLALKESLKAHLMAAGEPEGFLDLAVAEDGRIVGGVALGHHAAEILSPISVAIHLGARVQDLEAVSAAHPTLSELAFDAIRQATVS
jgi:dihydrolipoamide dehydrogenase